MNPAAPHDNDAPRLSTRTRAALVISTAAALVTLSACTVGPNYKSPNVPVPSNYNESPDPHLPTTQAAATQPTSDLTRWWTSFNDPALDSLVDRTIAGNFDLKTAVSRVREARALYGFTSADLFPTVGASYSWTRSRPSQGNVNALGSVGFPPGTPSERESNQAGFDMSWEIDVFGGVRRSMEAARYDIQSLEAARDSLITSLLAEVARNYFELRGFQQQIRIALENIRSQRDTLELTRARFNAGLASDLDVARAEAQVAATEAAIPNLQTSAKAAIHRISILTGQPPATLDPELAPDQPLTSARPTVPVGLPSELLRRRPEIRQAERNLAAATARIGAAQADYFPRFFLNGNLGVGAAQFENFFRSQALAFSWGPSVSWPIFDANRIKFNVEVTNQREQQAFNNYRQTVLLALEEVENTMVAFNRETIRNAALARAVAANKRAVDLSTQLYNKGLAAFLDVLDAQRALFATQDALAASDRIATTNLIALYKALGGGWETAPPTPNSPTNPNTNLGIGP